ncbi:MAG: ABC transporter permease [Balneolaceae bacterium]|nr:MAG: ABC transporter permease [Balneolaceae bacterium]
MSFSYIIKEGFAGLGRARLAAFTSVFSLFIALLLIGVLFRVGYNAYEVSQMLRQQVEVEVFLKPLSDSERSHLSRYLAQKPEITGITYISPDSASAIFSQEFGLGAEALSGLNFLPASFRVKVSDNLQVAQIDSLVRQIRLEPGVDEVRFNLALLQALESRTEILMLIGGGLGLFILFVAVILVFNTIRLTIYAKRELIRAMKLVGATNRFIRSPFLVEGVLQGVIAGSAASAVIWVVFEWLVPRLIPQVGILSWPFGRWYFLVSALLVSAVVMGWAGSRWAARKFIRDTRVYT